MLDSIDSEAGEQLLALARRTVEHGVQTGEQLQVGDALVAQFGETPVATFVTLEVSEQLNGCIGTLEARRAICHDIVYNAYQAAFHDPRFGPIGRAQLDALGVHISVLSALEPVDVDGQNELLEVLRPQRDGIVIRAGARRATFLPSVWEKLSTAEDFLLHLKRKARIGPLEWPDDMQVFRYRVLEFASE